MVNQASENLRLVKKNLQTPKEFKKGDHENNACFSYNYKLYGCLETWELAWDKLKDLPSHENIFHELILEDTRVKPYLDIEWYQEKFPELTPERVILAVKDSISEIFKKEWDYTIKYMISTLRHVIEKNQKGINFLSELWCPRTDPW